MLKIFSNRLVPYKLEKFFHKSLGTFHIDLNTKIFDLNGKIIKNKKQIAHSLTGSFLQYLYCNMSEGNAVDFLLSSFNNGNNSQTKSVNGNNINVNQSIFGFNCHCPANSDAYGIVLGTDSTPVSALDYKLYSKILSGSDPNKLIYFAQGSSQPPVANGNSTSFVLQRLFQNNSGQSITINEIGLYLSPTSSSSSICVFREIVNDILLSSQSYTVQLTFNVTT